MMHPHTAVRFISSDVGIGVIATKPLKKGTLIWVRDPLDRVLSATEVDALPEKVKDYSLTYMYRNASGEYVLLWDHGKYVNHAFSSNCMPTPYGFDIALRDIGEGEELTEDYGLLNIIEDFTPCATSDPLDRNVVRGDDLLRNAKTWDLALRSALECSFSVEQTLLSLVPLAIQDEIRTCILSGKNLRSVATMCHRS